MRDEQSKSVDEENSVNRRRILKMSGSAALASFGVMSGGGSATATKSEADQFAVKELSAQQKGNLRGAIFSSAAFKTIRRTTKDRGFKPRFGDVDAAELTHQVTGQPRLVLRVPCDYVGDKDDGRTRGAALFGHKKESEILARCISQCEGEPIFIDDCLVDDDNKAASMSENEVNVYKIPTNLGGD
jgi:hypothetical protein